MKHNHQTKKEQEQLEIKAEKTKTTTKYKYFVYTIVMIGFIAALSQLFTTPFNKDVEETRFDHKLAREDRDNDRINSVDLLDKIVQLQILPKNLQCEANNIVISHYYTEEKSQNLYNELIDLKKSKKVSGFRNLNVFLANIGNPIFILITGILFLFFYFFRHKIDWVKFAKFFFYISIIYLLIGFIYIYWALTPEREIKFIYYLASIFAGGILATVGLKYLLLYLFKVNSIEEEQYLEAIKILFEQLLYNIPKKEFIKDEKFIEFTESNNKVISKVADTID